ncbi:hypothetical protein BHE74_00040708 [Ensete ventricosum]|nr:hypothetical protein BHE74_00040708 [Ensete ventricosum]RZS17004.1 hypothetical protein BHM03_00049095 [Ensete ventricosum]
MINTAKEIVSTVKFTAKNMCPRCIEVLYDNCVPLELKETLMTYSRDKNIAKNVQEGSPVFTAAIAMEEDPAKPGNIRFDRRTWKFDERPEEVGVEARPQRNSSSREAPSEVRIWELVGKGGGREGRRRRSVDMFVSGRGRGDGKKV